VDDGPVVVPDGLGRLAVITNDKRGPVFVEKYADRLRESVSIAWARLLIIDPRPIDPTASAPPAARLNLRGCGDPRW
jgi:hypothetical protein